MTGPPRNSLALDAVIAAVTDPLKQTADDPAITDCADWCCLKGCVLNAPDACRCHPAEAWCTCGARAIRTLIAERDEALKQLAVFRARYETPDENKCMAMTTCPLPTGHDGPHWSRHIGEWGGDGDLIADSTTGHRLLDPDCRDSKHTSCVGAPCECDCHTA